MTRTTQAEFTRRRSICEGCPEFQKGLPGKCLKQTCPSILATWQTLDEKCPLRKWETS